MNIRQYGYKEKTVQLREMTIAELKLAIIERYIKYGVKEVQFIDISSGDTVTFNSIEDVTRNEWSESCKIEVINLPHSWGTETEYKWVVLFQISECSTDIVI